MTTSIGSGHWLDDAAAASYARMRDAGCPAGITSAGRTRAQQQALYDKWKAGLLPGTPSVAKPGTSRHETGLALDLPGGARAWVKAHGKAYGWISDLVKSEPWHFEYHPGRDTHKPSSKPAAVLKRGSKGDSVVRLQRALNRTFPAYARTVTVKRGQLLTTDGIFGAVTEAWVKEFQRRTGLTVDGIVGPLTLAKLAQYGITI